MAIASLVVAAGCAFVLVLLIERHAAALGLLDLPNERSSHVEARPRGGGLAVIGGVAAGLAVALLSGATIEGRMWTVLAGALLVAGVGLRDDVMPMRPAPRLAAQTAAATVVIWVCGGFSTVPLPAPLGLPLGAFGPVLALVWIVGVTNFFNFMDGADGLAGGQACLTFLGLAVALAPASATVVPMIAVAAVAAFLVRNWSPARIFLGDVGSGWIGFLLAALPLAAPVDRREDLVRLVATSLALFLIDPVVTLARRWWRGAGVTASHREHAYQRLFAPGQSHAVVVGPLLAAAGLLTAVAVVSDREPALAWWSLGLAGVVAAAEFFLAARAHPRRRHGARIG
jgi:Fuc2NAc and GlcNAc transferase